MGSWTRVSGHALLVPDLQDMSLVTLSTKTPWDFFSKHQLVLHVAKSMMDKVRVFQGNGESPLAGTSMFPSCPSQWVTAPSHLLRQIIPEQIPRARF